jgi:hypothetical protein
MNMNKIKNTKNLASRHPRAPSREAELASGALPAVGPSCPRALGRKAELASSAGSPAGRRAVVPARRRPGGQGRASQSAGHAPLPVRPGWRDDRCVENILNILMINYKTMKG